MENDKSLQYNTIIVPRGGEYTAVLEDGSKIYLNSDSRLKIPVAFKDSSRKVIFEKGEAYFEVTKDKTRPFIIDINGNTIKVLGTQFNVRNYPSEKMIATTLVEGSIQVFSLFTLHSSLIKPGQQAILGINGELAVASVNTYPYIAWKDGRMVFENRNLGDIMEELSRWYDFEVEYKGVDVKSFRFTIDIVKYESLNEILTLFKEMDKVGFDIKDKKVTVSRLN